MTWLEVHTLSSRISHFGTLRQAREPGPVKLAGRGVSAADSRSAFGHRIRKCPASCENAAPAGSFLLVTARISGCHRGPVRSSGHGLTAEALLSGGSAPWKTRSAGCPPRRSPRRAQRRHDGEARGRACDREPAGEDELATADDNDNLIIAIFSCACIMSRDEP